MFEFLFNQTLATWRDGRLVFESGWTAAALLAAIVLTTLMLGLSLCRRRLSRPRRLVVGILQSTVTAAILFMLWRPALEIETMEPGENVVAWVLDTSASMRRTDLEGGASRAALAGRALEAAIEAGDGRLATTRHALGERLRNVERLDALAASSPRSRLGEGLESLLDRVREQSLAGVVLASDGRHNGAVLDGAWWQDIAAAGVPVHTIGVGAPVRADDVELAALELPRDAMVDGLVEARLVIAHAGHERVRLRVREGERLLLAEDLELPPDRPSSRHRVRLPVGEAGLKTLDFELDAGAGEPDRRNNRQRRILQVRDAPKRVLYVEGEPRWEFKFIRRAADEIADVDIVSLLRTSANKFYRQGVADAGELADGFPKTRETLFAYDAVIIGSLEAAELDLDQQAALRDFVNVRGGSLLMLGGRHGLADGGWGRTPVAAALPVRLSAQRVNRGFAREHRAVLLTEQGERSDWLALDDDPARSAERWATLPELADHQAIGEPKAGAIVPLLVDGPQGAEPLLAWHRRHLALADAAALRG